MPDPIAVYGTEKLVEMLADKITSCVIEKWSNYRKAQFLNSFLAEMQEELMNHSKSDTLDEMLTKLTKDDIASSALFEAYRKVVLSASKSIGPKVIGLLTARITLDCRYATDEEELLFMAAEHLSDSELLVAARELRKWFGTKTSSQFRDSPQGTTLIELSHEDRDSNCAQGNLLVGPLDLSSEVGLWALKLLNIGLLSQQVTTESWEYKEDSERHVDQDGVNTRMAWQLIVRNTCLQLAECVERVRLS